MDPESIKPVKRVYVKKAKVVEPIPEIIENNEPESKPKRTYTKKKKEEETNDILHSDEITTTLIEEEKKPKRVYIKKNKAVVQEHSNIESINTQIDFIQKDLDNLKIIEEIEIEGKPIISNNISRDENILDIKECKRKFDDNVVQEAKKTSLYTHNIDIDINLNLYIYDKFFDGSKKNKKSVLQISSFISTHIVDLDQYIVKEFYIKSNNSDIKVCYLGKNFNNNGKYDFKTKLYIDNNIYNSIYEELKYKFIKNDKDIIFFKKYIVEIAYYEIYMNIY
jgi:hypothetical protein